MTKERLERARTLHAKIVNMAKVLDEIDLLAKGRARVTVEMGEVIVVVPGDLVEDLIPQLKAWYTGKLAEAEKEFEKL